MPSSEYLVRWKYEANTLLNRSDQDTPWYQQFHPNKDSAVQHYISLLTSDVKGIVVEIFRLTKMKK